MNETFKTPKGTTLYLMSIQGKPYLPVQERIIWFREEHPLWSIITQVVSTDDKGTIAHAEIKTESGVSIATAHKSETKQGFADHLEKAETGAIGRALALCGYGTQFVGLEFDEGKRLADAPAQPKAHEQPLSPSAFHRPASANGSDSVNGSHVIGFGKYKGSRIDSLPEGVIDSYIAQLEKMASLKNDTLSKAALDLKHINHDYWAEVDNHAKSQIPGLPKFDEGESLPF